MNTNDCRGVNSSIALEIKPEVCNGVVSGAIWCWNGHDSGAFSNWTFALDVLWI